MQLKNALLSVVAGAVLALPIGAGDRPLARKLEEMSAASAKKTPEDKRAAVKASFDRLRRDGIVERSLAVGAKAPDFALPDAVGKTVKVAELLARGPVVIAFYRGHW